MRGLPWWFWLAAGIVRYWFVTVPLAVLLAYPALSGAPWPGGLSWILNAVAIVLLLPFPAAAIVVLYQSYDATRFFRTLDCAESIDGLHLPAGARVRYADKQQTIAVEIHLPHVWDVRGMQLQGCLSPLRKWRGTANVWGADLASDQHLDGLPCRAGPYAHDRFGGIIFDGAGTIFRCTLASEHAVLGLKLPPGTTVTRGNHGEPWRFLLPADAGTEIPALGTDAPPGVTIDVADDGRLVRIGSGHGQTIIVRGVPLHSTHFELLNETVVAELAEPFVVAGMSKPAGTRVRLDLATGNVAADGE